MIKRTSLTIIVLLLGFNLSFHCEETRGEDLSIQERYSTLQLEKINTPQYLWLNNGKIMLLDTRTAEKDRNFNLYEPQTGKMTPAMDAGKIRTALKKLSNEIDAQAVLWPDAFEQNGKKSVSILKGDLFLTDLTRSTVTQLTDTEPFESSVSFSPDGNKIGFIRNNDIYVINLDTGKERQITAGASETLLNGPLSWVYWEEIYSHTEVPYKWSPDSQAIAYLQTDDSAVSVSTYVNFKPSSQEAIRQRYPKAGQENPKVRLGIVEISTAKTTWMKVGDYEYLARFKWLNNSKKIAVQLFNRRQNELRLMFAERSNGRSTEILTDHQPAWINLNYSLYFLSDGKRFIWSSERDGYQHLYLYTMEGRLINQLTKGEFMVVPSGSNYLGKDYSGLVGVDEAKGLVYFTSNQQSLREKHLYCVDLEGKKITRISQGTGVHGIAFSPDMSSYVDLFSNASTPPELSLHHANGRLVSIISPSAKNVIAPLDLSFPEFHSSHADDGLELPAMMIKPAGFDNTKKYPAVVYVYGGPQFQQVVDIWRTRRVVFQNVFAQAGYFVFVLEVRAGMGKSKALETSVYEQAYGMQNVKDILAGVKWIKKLPNIDPDRLGIWGGSGGGCTTLYTMTHSDVFKAGISLYPVSDWHYYDTVYTERYLNTPQNNPQGYLDTSAVHAAADLKGRLLLVHGSFDDNCHPQNTEAFIDVLIRNNIQFELMIYPWSKHGIGFFPDKAQLHLHTLMLDFWRRNL